MPELFLHKRRVESIFHLLGEHENHITYSVAWGLAQSPSFLHGFLKSAAGVTTDGENVVIRLQQHEKNGGITDIEIEDPGGFFIIVEAKRGWNLPSRQQLATYADRPSFVKSNAPQNSALARYGVPGPVWQGVLYGSWDGGWWSPWEYKEMRDDKVLFFTRQLWTGTYHTSYVARATTAGRFIRPPAQAVEMYNASVQGRSDGGVFVVKVR